MNGPRLTAAIGWLVVGLPACANDPVTVNLKFPSEETVLFSELVHIRAFAITDQELGACPRLITDLLAGGTLSTPSIDLMNVDICRVRSGGLAVDDVPAGPTAWTAVASDNGNTALLAGCAIAEVYADAPAVQIRMFMTEDYADVVAGRTLTCDTIENKCARGCQ
jgi:hypothetical protein